MQVSLGSFCGFAFRIAAVFVPLAVAMAAPAGASSVPESVRKSHPTGQPIDSFGRPVQQDTRGKLNYLFNQDGIDLRTKGYPLAQSIITNDPAIGSVAPTPDKTATRLPRSKDHLAPFLTEEWRVGIFGSGIGLSGFVAADIDADGKTEIIAGGSSTTFGFNDYWYVLRYNAATLAYDMVWVSDAFTTGITALSAFDVNNDNVWEVFVGLENGDIHIFDGVNHKQIGFLSGSAVPVNRLLFADIDNDSVKELVAVSSATTRIYRFDGSSFYLAATVSYGASDAAIGNVDADPALEFVLASGNVLEITRLIPSDAVSTVVEWTYAGGNFGRVIQLADIDSDGMQEIIGASAWYYITAFDADLQSPKWQIPVSLDIGALLLADTNNDGVPELLYGDGQWGKVHCLDAQTRTELWSITNPSHGVTNIGISDTDGDGNLEVFWGAGATTTGPDFLFVHELANPIAEWASQHIDGPFTAIALGDTDNNGSAEIVTASFSSNSGYSDGLIQVYSGQTHELLWRTSSNTFGENAWTGIHDVKIGNVDTTAEAELIVGTDRLYDGAIYVLDSITHNVKASYFYDGGAPIHSLAIADVDNDGKPEIIAGGGRAHTGAPGVYVYVIDGATGVVEWNSINLGAYWSEITQIAVGDVDGDGVKEIVALNDDLYVIDGITHLMWQTAGGGYRSVDLFDMNGDGRLDIVAGRADGMMVVLDGQSRLPILSRSLSASPIDALRIRQLDGLLEPEVVFTSSGRAQVFSLQYDALLWDSQLLAAYAAGPNALAVSNIDFDGKDELVVGADHAVYQFEGVETRYFVDVPIGHWAFRYIDALVVNGITSGCAPGRFCPSRLVTRAQLAVFLERGMKGATYVPPPATGTVFADVGAGDFAGAWIEQLANDGISSGCGGGNYCPNTSVTRAQMAVLLLRAKHGSAYVPPSCSGTMFTDVASSTFACSWIEQLSLEAITSGCGGGKFCPDGTVDRAQMAVLLQRTFGLPLPP